LEKITTNHLSRIAYVYIRQSTMAQLQRNMESRRVQERLVERAQAFGWSQPRIIDDDLGCTASGVVERSGFERLLAAVCAGEVGAIFAFEASRLARNGREWHALLELCAVVDTVLIDTEAVYDPKFTNDRLLLGLKGTLSELELGLFRARSQAAIREKARRGEYYGLVAVGYRKTRDGRLEKEADLRVQRALEFVFEKFPQFGSARQLVRWLREEQIKIPRKEQAADDSPICWRLPTQAALTSLLKNAVYAGAYVFGRSKRRTIIEHGRKRIMVRDCSDPAEWEEIIIRDHHPGYISWEQYERNVEMLRQNVNMKGFMTAGGIRGGASVFAGILRCGQCGRKVLVHYCGLHSRSIRYSCSTNCRNDDGKRCLSLSANALERTLVGQLLETVSPLGVEAALEAAEILAVQGNTLREQRELELVQARYESERARQQYNAVDPANRLVAGELERRWNEALRRVAGLEEELQAVVVADAVSDEERQMLLALGEDLAGVWQNPATSAEVKKRIARALVKEIVLFDEGRSIKAIVHWQGGEHTEVKVPRLTYRESASPTNTDTVKIIGALARQMADRFIARVLNRLKIPTAKGYTWNEARVRALRNGYEIVAYQDGEREARGEIHMLEAARELGVERRVIGELIKSGRLPASQVCDYAPWVIRREDLYSAQVQGVLRKGKSRAPCAENQKQLPLENQ
jgi:DNA invertase Pin-like site-specific DNA recombinase